MAPPSPLRTKTWTPGVHAERAPRCARGTARTIACASMTIHRETSIRRERVADRLLVTPGEDPGSRRTRGARASSRTRIRLDARLREHDDAARDDRKGLEKVSPGRGRSFTAASCASVGGCSGGAASRLVSGSPSSRSPPSWRQRRLGSNGRAVYGRRGSARRGVVGVMPSLSNEALGNCVHPTRAATISRGAWENAGRARTAT
jgi:hypothetical protein